MDTAAVTAVVSGASAIGGALVVTFGDAWRARAERRARERGELVGLLTRFGAAFDAFSMQLNQLPPRSRQGELVAEWVERRMPTVDYFFGIVARGLLGRPLFAALADFQRAYNDLLLIAPREVLAALEGIAAVLTVLEDRPPDFAERLTASREEFTVVARMVARGDLNRQPRWPRRRAKDRLALPASVKMRLEEGRGNDARGRGGRSD